MDTDVILVLVGAGLGIVVNLAIEQAVLKTRYAKHLQYLHGVYDEEDERWLG